MDHTWVKTKDIIDNAEQYKKLDQLAKLIYEDTVYKQSNSSICLDCQLIKREFTGRRNNKEYSFSNYYNASIHEYRYYKADGFFICLDRLALARADCSKRIMKTVLE